MFDGYRVTVFAFVTLLELLLIHHPNLLFCADWASFTVGLT
jgi:hypothetical protein